MYINAYVTGTRLSFDSEEMEPLNLGGVRLVTINELMELVDVISGAKLKRVYNLSAPREVRARNSDNTLIAQRFGWAPAILLKSGSSKPTGGSTTR